MSHAESRVSLSRRRFVQQTAVTAGAAVAVVSADTAAAGAAVDPSSDTGPELAGRTLVAATVVRASHSATDPGVLSLGVRASVLSPDGDRLGLVIVVEPVKFGLSTEQVNARIAAAVRARSAEILAGRGRDVVADDIVVQVFGGAL